MRFHRSDPSKLVADAAERLSGAQTITPDDADIIRPLPAVHAKQSAFADRFATVEDLVSIEMDAAPGDHAAADGRGRRSGLLLRAATRASALSAITITAAAATLLYVNEIVSPDGAVAVARPHEKSVARFATRLPLAASDSTAAIKMASVLPDVPAPKQVRLTLAPTLIASGATSDAEVRLPQRSRVAGIAHRVARVPDIDLPLRNPRFGRIAAVQGSHRFTSAELGDDVQIVPPRPRLRRRLFDNAHRSALGRGRPNAVAVKTVAVQSAGRRPPTIAPVGEVLPDWARKAFESGR